MARFLDLSPKLMAMQTSEDPKVGFVFVHGAFHGSWCWRNVEDQLRQAGCLVTSVDLPMRTLHGDAELVVQAIQELKDRVPTVVAVGHSYGGVVISAGAHRADALVYIAAGMPDAGESAASAADRMGVPDFDVSDDGTITASTSVAAEVFYGRCSAADVEYALPRLRGLSVETQQEVVEDPAWRKLRSTYVVCAEDRALAPEYQMERASHLDNSVIIQSDHSPFFSAVPELVEILEGAAGSLNPEHNGNERGK